MSTQNASDVDSIRKQLASVLESLVKRRDSQPNSWDAEWWLTLDFEWSRTEPFLRTLASFIPDAYRENHALVVDGFAHRVERQVRPFFDRGEWPNSSRSSVRKGLEEITSFLAVIESQLIRPQPFPSKARTLSERLTNGEWPDLVQRGPFAEPPLLDSDVSTLKGKQVLLLAATLTERNAILERMQAPLGHERILRVFEGAQTYYVGVLGSVGVALTTSRAGSDLRDGSAMVTPEAIGLVEPRAVVSVGIAFGGYTEKLRIGDVLVSTHVIPYGPAREQTDGRIHRGGEHDAGSILLNRFLEARNWVFPRSDGYRCKVVDGRMLSGPKLVDSLPFKTELFTDHPEAIGGEMEGTGVYAGSERRGISEWIIVKSVCDWGDGTKGDAHHALAATVAVEFVEHVFTPKGVLDSLRPFSGGAQLPPTVPTTAVQDRGSQIGTQNIVYGTQNVVYGTQMIVSSTVEADALMDAIQTLIDKGHLEEVDKRLTEMNDRMWPRLTTSQQARLRALRAMSKAEGGDEKGAARDLFEAYELAPNELKAPVRRAQALLLLDRSEEAYAVARSALTDSPHHPYIRPVLIRSAPASISLSELLPPNWRDLGMTSAEAVAGFERVRDSEPSLGEEFLLNVRAPKADDKHYWYSLAAAKSLVMKNDEERGLPIPDVQREQLLATLATSYSSIVPPSRPVVRGVIALDLAILSRRLHRDDEYKRWLSIAKELIPDSTDLQTERAHEAIARADFRTASELLRNVVTSPKRRGLARVVFANVLLKLGTQEARLEALTVLDTSASDPGEPSRDRSTAALRLVEALMDDAPADAASALEKHRDVLGAHRFVRLRLVLAHVTGSADEAQAIADEIVASKTTFTRDELLDLGSLSGELRLSEQCVALLEHEAPRTELAPSTIALINAGMALGRRELVRTLCNTLRINGVEDAQVVEGEIYLLSVRGDLSGALSLAQEWLSKHPDDKRIRFHLCQVAHDLGRTELLATRADQLPTPTDKDPEFAPNIVRILRAASEHGEAREFAYRNLKRRRRDPWAWQAVSLAGLPGSVEQREAVSDEQTPLPTLIAGPGMAVRIKERDSSKWIQLETSDDLATAPDEYGPTHAITIALTGKKVGDRVELQKGQTGFRGRSVEITAISSCFVRTCQHCNEQYELEFPDLPFVHSIDIPDSIDDFVAALLEGAKERKDDIRQVIDSYSENPRISLHALASTLSRPIFEMVPLLVSNQSHIHAARPSETMALARKALQQTGEIIVEVTAVSTLAMLEAVSRTRANFSTVWIARGTVDRLRAYVQRAVSDSAPAHMGLEGDRLFYSVRDEAFEGRRADYLRKLLASIEAWDVFDEKERGQLTSTAWDNWTRIAGGGTADSVHRSMRLRVPLWTDDVAIAAASLHEGALPISTQAVFETLAAMGSVTREEVAAIGARLVGWRYVDTRTPPESFLAAAELAEWNSSTKPLVQHLELLTVAQWPDPNLLGLVAEVFRLWWNACQLDRNRFDAVVVATLLRLSARPNSRSLLFALPVLIRRRFGLDAIGAEHVSELILGWIASHPQH